MSNEGSYPNDEWMDPVMADVYWSQEQFEAPYDVCLAAVEYNFHAGRLQMPVSGPPTDAQVGYGQGGGAIADRASP